MKPGRPLPQRRGSQRGVHWSDDMKSSAHPLPSDLPASPSPSASRTLNVLLIDVEPATADLAMLWLAAAGWELRLHPGNDGPVALILIELAFPKSRDRQRLEALAEVWPGAPIVALSPTFRSGLPAQGDVAHQLGATAVLATPLSRERFLEVVRGVVGTP